MKKSCVLYFVLLLMPCAMFSCSRFNSNPNRNTIAAIHYQSSRLQIHDVGEEAIAGAVGGAAGAFAAAIVTEIIADHGEVPRLAPKMLHEDPLLRVKSRFLGSIPSSLIVVNISEGQSDPGIATHQTEEEELLQLKRQFGTRELLDFRTTELRAVTHQSRNMTPILGYCARVRLINLDNKRVEWEGFCHIPEDRMRGTTEAALAAEGGKLLQDTFNSAADSCADELLQDFLKRGLPKQQVSGK